MYLLFSVLSLFLKGVAKFTLRDCQSNLYRWRMILPYLDKNKPTKDISLFSIFNLNKLLIVSINNIIY